MCKVFAFIYFVLFHSDLLQNAAVTPVKKLQYHTRSNDYGVFCAAFHPTQPWLFSGGADNTIRLYT
jgi:ribosome biogenesis protein ERB1